LQRTSRFKLVFKKENKDDPKAGKDITPNWLALHEFQNGDAITNRQGLLLGQSVAIRKVEGNAKKIDVVIFALSRGFGDGQACWVDDQEGFL
jgi:hypothetical protein